MANIKITDLTAYTDPATTDVVPIVDVGNDTTKKVSVGEVVGKISGDVDVATDGTSSIASGVIVDADVNANAEIAVSKLADGTARQLLQTDAAGTGVEWTDNVDVPGTLDVTGATTLDSTLDVDGQSTLASAAVSDLTEDRVVIAGASGELEDSANLTFDGSELTVGGDLTVTGDLTVEGATTTIETTTLLIEDKNIEMGVVDTPSDTTADGGGITLKGATDKTINWVNATDAWTSSEHIELASGKEFYIDGNGVLNATTLGSGVVNSSLTSVGTIATGTWEGTAIDAAYLDSTVVTTSDTGTVTSTMILDGTIVNDDVNASAAIAGTKISPDFGSQNIETSGDINLDDGGTYETTVQVVTPTANRTCSFPDATGTVALVAGSNGQLIYNSSGAQAGLSTLTTDGTDVTLTGRFISSLNGAASEPPGTFTGTWFTGGTSTTTKPQVLIEPSGTTSTAWSTSGTGFGVNAESGFSGNLADLQLNGTSEWAFSTTALTVGDANDIAVGTTTGTKIGTATTQKLGFYNATPVVQPTAVADITTTATSGSLPTPDGSVTIADAATPTVTELLEYCVELEAKLEAALGHLRTLGLIAT